MFKSYAHLVALLPALVLAGCAGRAAPGGHEDPTLEAEDRLASSSDGDAPEGQDDGCFDGHEGDASSCKAEDTWKSYAVANCLAAGADLASIELIEPCDEGFRFVKYGCCGAAATSPSSPPQGCSDLLLGGPGSCKPKSAWAEYADDDCNAQGATLASIDFVEPCGSGASRYASYTCCGP